jgi:hypothetical protein
LSLPVAVVELAPPTVTLELVPPTAGVQVDPESTEVALAAPQVIVEAGPSTVVFAVTTGPPGEVGPVGPGGSGAVIIGTSLGGAQNGVNVVFTTPDVYISNSTGLYVNGLRQRRSVDYTESASGQITFSDAPAAADHLSIDYTIV